MPDYKEGKIYKLKCKETFEVYIGSTVQPLNKRIISHTSKGNHCVSMQIIERGNYEFELIEDFPCDTSRELHAREQYWIDNTENTINIHKEYESKEAYIAHTKEYQKEYSKKYRNGERREELLNISRQYHQTHRARQNEIKKQYNLKNKDAIKANKTEVIQCECGSYIQRAEKARHCRSRKHLDNLPS
tara:strand:+ start:128 stop:691 length:564 start_codon:yes stop_codon:yes gene_type:complete